MWRHFKAVVEPEAEGGFSVHIPALPGCASQGGTVEEALTNIKEAVEVYLESLRADGLSIPKEDVEVVVKDVEVNV